MAVPMKLLKHHNLLLPASSFQHLPLPDAVPETLPNGGIVLRHHLIDEDPLGLEDCAEVRQGEDAHSVADMAPAEGGRVISPEGEVVSRKGGVVLTHFPASINLNRLGHSGKGWYYSLIWNIGLLHPI